MIALLVYLGVAVAILLLAGFLFEDAGENLREGGLLMFIVMGWPIVVVLVVLFVPVVVIVFCMEGIVALGAKARPR